jgi:hypothetical protein
MLPMDMPDPASVARHVIQLLGGQEKAFQVLDADFQAARQRWAQDTGKIGRILRAHLFVEHFLSEHLQAKNPNLGSLNEARITFAQKLSLIDARTSPVAYLLPGMRRLNTIRNRIAHSLHADVTEDDAREFMAARLFTAMREELAKTEQRVVSSDPIDIMEDFAIHAGSVLHQSPMTAVWEQAFQTAQKECKQRERI